MSTSFAWDEYRTWLATYRAASREEPQLSYRKTSEEAARKDDLRAEIASLTAEYRARLPVYLLARCPFCGGEVHEAIDTYSLNGPGWSGSPDGFGWYPDGVTYEAACDHAVGVVYGVNLNGLTPDDVTQWVTIGAERPFVLPPYLTLDHTVAVLHTLPVSRLDDPAPQPRYTMHLTTYFTEDHAAFQAVSVPYHEEYTSVPIGVADYDLPPWIAAGKLRWLDRDDPHLPLRSGPASEFPYANMGGMMGMLAIHNGTLRLMYGPKNQPLPPDARPVASVWDGLRRKVKRLLKR